MEDDQEYWDGLDPWNEPEVQQPQVTSGGALVEIPRNARRNLYALIAVLTAFAVLHVAILLGPARGEGVVGVMYVGAAVTFIVGVAAYKYWTFSYIAVYPDHVRIRRRRYELGDVRWLDVYSIQDDMPAAWVNGVPIPRTYTFFELVFSVWTPGGTQTYTMTYQGSELELTALIERLRSMLPNLQVDRKRGVEDRSWGPLWFLIGAMGRR